MEQPLGAFIAEQRKKLRKTQRQVARESGLSSGFLSMIERGASSASPQTLEKLARPLHASYERLLVEAGYLAAEKRRRYVPARVEAICEQIVELYAEGFLQDRDVELIERIIGPAVERKRGENKAGR